MTDSRGPGLRTALLGGALLAAATPPAVFPGAEFLVLGGLALWFTLAVSGRRPLLHSYLLGCVHMAWFSWSVRHVMLPAYAAIVVLGGFYFVFGTVLVRRLPRRFAVVAFAVAVAAAFWLRANMPEIWYPHGQPCHCLWQWPLLLGSLRLGGEPLANALLGALAASAVVVWQSWRVGTPDWRVARRTGAITFVAAAGVSAVGVFPLGAASPDADAGAAVSIAAIEPGLHSFDPRTAESFGERLHEPARALLTTRPRPDLVLWPESSVPIRVPLAELEARPPVPVLARLDLPPGMLLLGANVGVGDHTTPSAFLVDLPSGRVTGRHDKRRLVPGGEFLPLVGWLPDAMSRWIHDGFAAALGSAPDCVPGQPQPPMELANGIRFGALLCYDNAFPGPAADHVAAGARFLCVLSNESWYRGGGELVQLVAMSVCRALELATPMVRCTTDGWSVAISAEGRVFADLPIQPSPSPAARILRVDLPLGPGRLPPLAWLAAATGPLAAFVLGSVLLHALWAWARLRVARTAPSQR